MAKKNSSTKRSAKKKDDSEDNIGASSEVDEDLFASEGGEEDDESGSDVTLVLETSSDEQSGSDDEEGSEGSEKSSEYEIYAPPETKVLPSRSTRGKRYKELLGEEQEVDQTFWGHDTWEEEENDNEWSTEDEQHYRDKFDSDFLESDSDLEEAASEAEEGRRIDKSISKEENLAKRRKFDYEQVAKRRQQRKEQSNKVWSVLDPRFAGPGLPVPKAKKGGAVVRRPLKSLQQQLLEAAAETEKANTQLQRQLDVENDHRKIRQGGGPRSEGRMTGITSTLVSWSSERKIESEEARKSEAQKRQEAHRPPFERQLLLFNDASHPTSSSYELLPEIYRQEPPTMPPGLGRCVVTRQPARYMDPVTRLPYATAAAFRQIRLARLHEEASKVNSMMQNVIEVLEPSTEAIVSI